MKIIKYNEELYDFVSFMKFIYLLNNIDFD